VIWASSEVKNDSKDNESNDCKDLDGAAMECNYRYRSADRWNCFYAREDEFGFSVCT
jgi:hypothetical protein